MPKFAVYVQEVHIQKYEVIANSADEAVEKVSDGEGEVVDKALEYSHSLETNTWEIEFPSGRIAQADKI